MNKLLIPILALVAISVFVFSSNTGTLNNRWPDVEVTSRAYHTYYIGAI